MKKEDFKKLLELVKPKLPNDLSKVYAELTWWDNVYKPMIVWECPFIDKESQKLRLIFGADNCSTYKNTFNILPTDFIICNNSQHSGEVISHPLTIETLYEYVFSTSDKIKEVEFMVCSHDVPINVTIDINPYATRVYENSQDSTILLFYASDGGGEASRPVDNMKPEYIRVIRNPYWATMPRNLNKIDEDKGIENQRR